MAVPTLEMLFLTLLLLLHQSLSSADESLVVGTAKGRVKGIKELTSGGREFFSYLGIPFAKPPLGHLRFEDPVENSPWIGTLDAASKPKPCIQYTLLSYFSLDPQLIGSEDCLYLNVFTHNPNQKAKPVMVFIHGGGFFSGSARVFPPYALMDQDIVLVVLQYRLHLLGFLSTEDDTMPGNYALKDQTLGLKWVKQNIAGFGGDPDNISIFGESAGAASVHYQMLTPWSKDLFNRAITQSGSSMCPWAFTKSHRSTAEQVGKMVGCPLEKNSLEFLECLKKVDSIDLIKPVAFSQTSCHLPRVDGDYLPDHPAKLVKNRQYNKVDLMTGVNRDEGALFLFLYSQIPQLYEAMKVGFSEETIPMPMCAESPSNLAQIVKQAYQHYMSGDKTPISKISELLGEANFHNCGDFTALLHSSDPEIKVFRYEFHHRGKFSIGDMFDIEESKDWVSHVDELYYLFEGGDIFKRKMQDPDDLKIRQILTKLWSNFAATGNPTPDNSLGFKWEQNLPNNETFLKISLNPTTEVISRQKTREFWLSLPLEQNKFLRDSSKEKEEL